MKDTLVKNNWIKGTFLAVVSFVFNVCAVSSMTCEVGDRWNGSATLEVSGHYVTIDANGFNGTVMFGDVTILNVDYSQSSMFSKNYVYASDPTKMKIQTSGEANGKIAMRYDPSNQTVYVIDGGALGAITVDEESVCLGADANLYVVDVDLSSYNVSWGVLKSASDTTWLTQYADKTSISYTMETLKPVTFISKVVAKSGGETVVSSIEVSPSLEDCGFFMTTSGTKVCLSKAINLATTYTSGTSYSWKDDLGNDYGSTTTSSISVTPKKSGIYNFSVFADGLKVASTKVEVTPMSDCGFTVSAKRGYACLGGSDSLYTNFTGASSYVWRDADNQVVGITNVPYIAVSPTESTTYSLYADELYVGSVDVESRECSFFIASKFPISSCLQDTNILMAVGTAMLEDIEKPVFKWYYSKDSISWVYIDDQSTYQLPVWAENDYYYKVEYNGLSEGLFYPKPDCSSQQYCDGLEMKTLFYETFGFFMAENVYVRDEAIYQSKIDVDHTTSVTMNASGDKFTSGDFVYKGDYYSARASAGDKMSVDMSAPNTMSIRHFVAPDPNGCVVTATNFINPDGNGANQFVGTNGHLYLTENPMLSQYMQDTWCTDGSLRLQDGYYAIVSSPDSCDHNKNHKDFIACSDYTGNKNGAMLFVNAGQTDVSKAAIYAQKASLSCPADRFNFGMSVRNATNVDSTESKNPVNLTICLLKEFNDDAKTLPNAGDPNVLGRVTTGDVVAGKDWTRIDEFIQLADKTPYVWVVIYNDGKSGDGNDMLLDDITFSVCIPKAGLLATMHGDTLKSEAVSCSGDEVVLHAFQTSTYLENPLYIFQYEKTVGTEKKWVDLIDYSSHPEMMSIDSASVLTKDSNFWGEVSYRVIVSDDKDVIRKVADGMISELTECEFTFHQATTNITIRNTYGGEMAPRDSVAFCNIPGTVVQIPGERILTVADHEWTMSWLASDSTVIYTKDVKGVSKDTLTLTVLEGNEFSVKASDGTDLGTFPFAKMDSLIFRGNDEGGCSFYQNVVTHAKMNLNIAPEASSIVDCNSATVKVVRNYTEPTLVFDWSSVPGTVTVVDDTTQTFVPDNLNAYSVIEGSVKITPVNVDDKYCFLQDQIEVPYSIHNGHYTMSITSSKDPVCVSTNERSYDTEVLVLTAKVKTDVISAEEAAKIDQKITSYKWHVEFSDGSSVDTVTTTKELTFTNLDLLNGEKTQIKANQLMAYISATTTDVCATIEHDAAPSEISIEIREGGFSMFMDASNAVCLLNQRSQELQITISPATALLNIDKVDLYMNGIKLKELTELNETFKVVLDDATYPSIFKSGNTAVYKVSVYDMTCKSENESNEISVKYNAYDWKFNEPDSCLTAESNNFNIMATIDSANAVNHIASYSWSLNGTPLIGTGLSYAYPVEQSMTGTFKLVTSDGICPDVEHEFTSNIAINYSLSITCPVKKICSTESAVISTVVTPESSRAYIKSYSWYAIDTLNNTRLLLAGKATESQLTLSKQEHPELFVPGNSFKIFVVADDSICSSAMSNDTLHFDVNEPFRLSLSASSNSVCYQPGDKLELNVSVDPANAINHIPGFIYRRTANDKEMEYISESTTLDVTSLEGWMRPADQVKFEVFAFDGICVSSASPETAVDYVSINTPYEVSLVTDKSFACSKNDLITLVSTNTQALDSFVHYTYEFHSALNDSLYNVKNLYQPNPMMLVDTMNNYQGFVPGSVLYYSVTINDGNICGPVMSNVVPVVIQTPFKAHVEVSNSNVCANEIFRVDFVSVEPAEALNFLKMFSWQKVGAGSVGNLNESLIWSEAYRGYDSYFANISDGICYGTEKFPPLQSDTVTVKVNEPVTVSLASSTNVFCEQAESLPITITATAYSGEPLQYDLYDWTTENPILMSSVQSSDMSYSWQVLPNSNMKRFVAVVYDGVCPGAFDANGGVVIDIHQPILFDIAIPTNEYNICLGDSVHFVKNVYQGAPTSFDWYGLSIDYKIPFNQPWTKVDVPALPGEYSYTVIASDGVCPDVPFVLGPVKVYEQPVINLIASKPEVTIGSTVDFLAEIVQGEPISFEWTINGNSLAITDYNQLLGYLPQSSAEYKVFASDGVCPSTSSSLEIGVLIPTAITPHIQDGMNDVFMKGFYVVIFDRYGMKVFEGNDGWDGTKNGVIVDPGVYYCNVQLKDGTIHKGTIEIIKID